MKYFIVLGAFLGSLAFAQTDDYGRETLVGSWSCVTKRDLHYFKSVITFHDDGTAHEKWASVYHLGSASEPFRVTALSGRYRWQFVSPSHYTISDVKIDDYRSYNMYTGVLSGDELEQEKVDLLSEIAERTEPIKVQFINANQMTIPEPAEYDDCQRINTQ